LADRFEFDHAQLQPVDDEDHAANAVPSLVAVGPHTALAELYRPGTQLFATIPRGVAAILVSSATVCRAEGRVMTRRGVGSSVLTVLLLFVAACHSGGSVSKPNPSSGNERVRTTVVLGLYSGVPDPSWQLTPSEAKELTALLAKLTTVVGRPPQGGLGYHGFTITGPRGTLIAFRGTVAPSSDKTRTSYLDDPRRTVERLLLETARSHVTRAEYALAQQGLQ
jgi:hypothetical protein